MHDVTEYLSSGDEFSGVTNHASTSGNMMPGFGGCQETGTSVKFGRGGVIGQFMLPTLWEQFSG